MSAMGSESGVDNELVEIRGLQKVTEDNLVGRLWVDGSKERTWKPSLRIRLNLF